MTQNTLMPLSSVALLSLCVVSLAACNPGVKTETTAPAPTIVQKQAPAVSVKKEMRAAVEAPAPEADQTQPQAIIPAPEEPQTVPESRPMPETQPQAEVPLTAELPAWRRPASPTLTRGSDDAIFAATKKNNMELLKQLLNNGTPVDHRNFNGETSLHMAASLGNLQMVKYLLSQGANINDPTSKNWLPIHHAIRFDRLEVAQYLIANGASLSAKNSDGLTALDFAKASKDAQVQALANR